jgi:hypothetical protein
MVASSANSPTSNAPLLQANKTKATAYNKLEHRTKAVASHTHSKSFLECANLFAPCFDAPLRGAVGCSRQRSIALSWHYDLPEHGMPRPSSARYWFVFPMRLRLRKMFCLLHLFLVWGIIWSAQTCLRFVFGLPVFWNMLGTQATFLVWRMISKEAL